MSSAVEPKDDDIVAAVVLLRRMCSMLSQQNAVDSANRQRITVDTITAGVTLPIVASVTNVANIAAMAGEGVRQFEVPARNCYSNSIRNKLTFG